MLEQESQSVEGIIKALSELEGDIDVISYKVEELKKHMIIHSNEEIEKLKQQINSAAQKEAKQIIHMAKTEAESDSVAIAKEAEENNARIRKNIDSLSDTIVNKIVKMVMKGSVSSISGAKPKPNETLSNSVGQVP